MGESVRFDENSELSANYTIMNWHRSPADGSVVFREVGYYLVNGKKGAKLSIDKRKILWNGYLTEVSHFTEAVALEATSSKLLRQVILWRN